MTLGAFTIRSTVRHVHGSWGDSAIMRGMHLILTNTPFFPIQVVAGAYLGWKFHCRWGHRSMLWVWILPGLLLTYAVFAIPVQLLGIPIISRLWSTVPLLSACTPRTDRYMTR